MNQEWYKKSMEADKNYDAPFFCKVGQVESEVRVYIEPDPHGDGKGTHAHFHTMIRCPKIKIVDFPEPDRCQVTDETCPFVAPFGDYERDSGARRWVYAQRFLHHVSFIEFYGMQLIYLSLISKGFKMAKELPDLRYVDIIRFLHALGLVNSTTCNELDDVRKQRNKLAHRPKAYRRFKEKELFELVSKAQKLAGFLGTRISELHRNQGA